MKENATDAFLADCEPYFIDGVYTIAQFAQRTQDMIRKVAERRWKPLVEALGFEEDQVSLLDYWYPDKLQKAKPTDEIDLGVKLKVSDVLEVGIYRYWRVEEKETGVEVYTWIKGRTKLDVLSKTVDDLPDEPPGPESEWDFWTSNSGTYFVTRSLQRPDLTELSSRLDDLITYYIDLVAKVGGVKRFLD